MEFNLPLEGRTPEETRRLLDEWQHGRRIFVEGGNYDAYLAATPNLRQDRAVFFFAGDLTGTRQDDEADQAAYASQKEKFPIEPETLR